MSDLRFLFRNVYRKLHELPDRSTRYGTAWKRNDPGGIFRAYQTREACGYGGYGYVPQKHPSERYHDQGCDLKRTDRRHGVGMFYQQYVTSSGDRA